MVTAILFGLYSAAVGIAVNLILYFAGLDKAPGAAWSGIIPFLASVLFLYLAMKQRKEEDFDGTITYGQCIGTGALVGVFSGIVMAIFMYLYYTSIDPSMVDEIVRKSEAAMRERNVPPDRMAQALSMTRSWAVPGTVLSMLFGSPAISTVLSLIIGLFVRTKPEEQAIKAV